MCGIVGMASRFSALKRDSLVAARDQMAHRGPDGAGYWKSDDGRVALAHRRLAIIDLSPGGHQPMTDKAGEVCITFNGEIYNYPELRRELVQLGHMFRSSSDTEVIIESYLEWGTGCLSRLNGMFAFALYDTRKSTLFLARDRAGEKPLYYSIRNGSLAFASELKALMADPEFPREIDFEGLNLFLALGHVPGDRCILKDVNKLPPASAMLWNVDTGDATIWRYWQLPPPPRAEETPGISVEHLVEELHDLLLDSVKRQLASDVPVGILLSGGVDSSLVTVAAARHVSQLKTFTIRFPDYPAYDESSHARLIAAHVGSDHIELVAEPSLVTLLPLLARQYDEPLADSSIIPTYLVSRLVKPYCSVALGGDGCDELFGGYPHYRRLLKLQRLTRRIPFRFHYLASLIATRALPLGFKGRNFLQLLGVDLETGLPVNGAFFDAASRRQLLTSDIVSRNEHSLSAEYIRNEFVSRAPDLVERATRTDFENYLVEDILVKVDRASMLTSLEMRCPWLDHRIVEFAFGKVSSRFKASLSEVKILPKKLARKLLPPEFDFQRKQGFSIPLGSWLQGKEWYDFFKQCLLESHDTPFDRRFVADMLSGQAKGRSHSERLFALVLFELWRQEYRVTC